MSVLVVYDQGAVSPTEIVRGVGADRGLVVVLAASTHARRMRPLFEEASLAVHDLTEPDLVDRLRRHGPAGVVTFAEPVLGATARLARELGLRGHDAATVTRLTDKDAQRRALRAAGVDATATATVRDPRDWADALARAGLPAVVKPVRGVSSRNTVRVDTPAAGRAALERLLPAEGAVVVEEYLAGARVDEPFGDYVSVETAVVDGRRHHLAVTGKLRLVPPFRECGQFWPARGVDTAAVTALADRAAAALGVTTGILHTEVKLTPDGPRLIEVNGRAGGYIPDLARRAVGLDLVDLAVRIACGEPADPGPATPDGVVFQLTTPAPTEPGTVLSTSPASALDGIAGVEAYLPFARRGTPVGGVGTQDLDLVAGRVRDHAELARTVERILDAIAYRFDFGGRHDRLTARDLIHPDSERSLDDAVGSR